MHHLARVEDYLDRYIHGERYEDCLRPTDPEYLIAIKRGKFNLADAEDLAAASIAHVTEMADQFCELVPEGEDPEMAALLADVQYQIMKISITEELRKGD